MAAVVVAAGAFADAAPAADGDPVLVGNQATGSSTEPALWGVNNSGGTGVYGQSDQYIGVMGITYASGGAYGVYGGTETGYAGVGGGGGANHIGVFGMSGNSVGVLGQSVTYEGVHGESASGIGVKGNSQTGSAIQGVSENGWGVAGMTLTGTSTGGVYGNGGPTTGIGVLGQAVDNHAVSGEASGLGSGVRGSNTGSGPGVTAVATTGHALDVQGKARFSNAGKAFVRRGKSVCTVSGVKVGTNSGILVTLMGDPGVVVKRANRLSDTSFRVFFSGRALRNAAFAYFIFN